MPCCCLFHSVLKELRTEVGTPIHSTDQKVLVPCHLGRDIAHAAMLLGGLSVSALVRRLFCRCVSSILAVTLGLTCISYRYFVSPPHFWFVSLRDPSICACRSLSLPVLNLHQCTAYWNHKTSHLVWAFCFPARGCALPFRYRPASYGANTTCLWGKGAGWECPSSRGHV